MRQSWVVPILLVCVPSKVSSWSSYEQSLRRRRTRTFKYPHPSSTTSFSYHLSSTQLNGKLWDKLQIEPDAMDEPPQWYVMNCVAGLEMDLLAQCKHVTKDMPTDLIEKFSVPTERSLRSHGKSGNVVELKSRYPGYVVSCEEINY